MRIKNIIISTIFGIIGAILSIILVIIFINLIVITSFYSEKLVINSITASWNYDQCLICNNNKHYCNRPYLCYSRSCEWGSIYYKYKVDIFNKNTDEFYSYDNYYKINSVPILPYAYIIISSLINVLILNPLYFLLYVFISAPFMETFYCQNEKYGLFYTCICLLCCAIILCYIIISYVYDYLGRRLDDNNTNI